MWVSEQIINDKEIELTFFDNPLFHEDWHNAEELGLKYVKYYHRGPDYWDDEILFCKTEDYEIMNQWIEDNTI
jgi:hypothetical protein